MKLKLNCLAIFCLAASLATPGFAQGSGADTFKSKCALCHGVDGMATTPAGKALKAASFKDPKVVNASDAVLTIIIKTGKGKMPSFDGKLSDAEIKGVIGYIRTLEK